MAGQGNPDRGWFQIYQEIPVVTRLYTTACVLLTLAVNFEFISQYQVYLNPDLIVERYEYWRIITSFLYSGPFNFGTVFHLLFSYRYSRILEESYYHQRSSDFFFMYIFMTSIILLASVAFTTLVFLGHALTHAILYLWCRRNPQTRVIIFGLFTLQADQVPFVLIALSIATGNPLAADVIAIVAGHTYYFLEDVFPKQRVGFRILKTPRFLKQLFHELPESEGPHERIEVIDENNNIIDNNQAFINN